jgi:transmembrane sensor
MDEQLLMRFLTRQCSGEDLRKINEWIQEDKANAAWLFEGERIWSLKDELKFSDKKEVDFAFNQFLTSLKSPENSQPDNIADQKVRSLSFGWVRYAAAIIIVVLLSVNIYNLNRDESASFNTIEVPKGQRVALTLSDSTKVWLNSDSRLIYPSKFSKNERAVTLEGEGYFEVVKSAKRPFIVHSSDLVVKVLGTKFNMRVYKNEGSEVTLNEGRVEVSAPDQERKIMLLPQEQVSYSKKGGFEQIKNIDLEMAESWRKGELAFMAEPLAEIVKTLERKFDKEIIVKDQSLERELFTCRVKQDATLEQVLSLLKDTGKLGYEFDKDKVFIIKK